MSKPNGLNGKTGTYFEQIPVAVVEQIAVVDGDEEQAAAAEIQPGPDRRTPATPPPTPPGKES